MPPDGMPLTLPPKLSKAGVSSALFTAVTWSLEQYLAHTRHPVDEIIRVGVSHAPGHHAAPSTVVSSSVSTTAQGGGYLLLTPKEASGS